MPETAPHLPQFHRFYERYAQRDSVVSRQIHGQPIEFPILTACAMTRAKHRTALALRETEGEFNEKQYRLFLYEFGERTTEYRIVDALFSAAENHSMFFHAQSLLPGRDGTHTEGLLQLGAHSNGNRRWITKQTEYNLDDISNVQIRHTATRPFIISAASTALHNTPELVSASA